MTDARGHTRSSSVSAPSASGVGQWTTGGAEIVGYTPPPPFLTGTRHAVCHVPQGTVRLSSALASVLPDELLGHTAGAIRSRSRCLQDAEAAVDSDNRAGDTAEAVVDDETDDSRHIVGFQDAAEDRIVAHVLPIFRGDDPGGRIRADESRGDDVDGDSVLS